MKKNNVLEFVSRDAICDPLTALLRSGAQQLINQAVEAELQELLSQYSDWRIDDGHSVVVRNGYFIRARSTDRVRACDGQGAQNSFQDGGTPNIPLSPCSS